MNLCFRFALLAALPLAGCRKRDLPSALDVPPDVLIAALRAREAPAGAQARFGIRIVGPDNSASTKGAMILRQPDDMRIEILSPVNTPLLYLVTDGSSLNAWDQRKGTFYRGDDAGAVMEELLQGAAGVGDVIAVLTGALPLPKAEVLSTSAEGGLARVALQGPGDVQVQAWVDGDTLIRRLRVARVGGDAPPVSLMDVEYGDYSQVKGSHLPDEVDLRFPTLGWSVELDVGEWTVPDEVPDVFTLAPPEGAEQQDLVETLRRLASQRRGETGDPR